MFLHHHSNNGLVLIIIAIIFVGTTCSAARSSSSVEEQHQCPIAKYHADSSCDRKNFNTFRHRLNRGYTLRALRRIGASGVADAKTVYCPQENDMEDLRYSSPTKKYTLTGFTSMWLVENTASTPVVVAWVNNNNGREYSAANSKIIPPTLDPNAMIPPGQYKFFLATEGHVFHVRAVLEDGTMGEVLLQHRQGLTPVTNRFGPPDLYCDPNEPDIEPMLETDSNIVKKPDPEYHRESDPTPLCNVIDIGFRNRVGCPLNAYFMLGGKQPVLQKHNETTTAAAGQRQQQQQPANERFHFHLGTDPLPNNFACDWVSQTKWEGTYIGHQFIFRLAKDPSILIDEVSIEPTFVPDCPAIRKKEKIQTEAMVDPIGTLHYIPINDTTTTKTKIILASANATNNQRRQRATTRPMLKFNDTTYAPTNHFFSAALLTH